MWRVAFSYISMLCGTAGSASAEAFESFCASLYAVPNRLCKGSGRRRECCGTLWHALRYSPQSCQPCGRLYCGVVGLERTSPEGEESLNLLCQRASPFVTGRDSPYWLTVCSMNTMRWEILTFCRCASTNVNEHGGSQYLLRRQMHYHYLQRSTQARRLTSRVCSHFDSTSKILFKGPSSRANSLS